MSVLRLMQGVSVGSVIQPMLRTILVPTGITIGDLHHAASKFSASDTRPQNERWRGISAYLRYHQKHRGLSSQGEVLAWV